MMIDFNSSTEIFNKFLGAEFKKTIIYNGEVYMLKFPDPIREKNNSLSYKNNQYSEHIGCEIFKSCGIKTQETILGTYSINGKNKIVVACKDFTQDGTNLIEFAKLANANVESERKAHNTIEDIYTIINNNDLIINKEEITEKFWDMFVIDTLIGNEDRHFSNWGLIEKGGNLSFAPIYDCGSSLGAIHSDDEIINMLENPELMKNKEYNLKSVYNINGKRIFYHEIYKHPPKDLVTSILKIFPRINIFKIQNILENTESLDETKKEFLFSSLNVRYVNILKPAYNRELRKL